MFHQNLTYRSKTLLQVHNLVLSIQEPRGYRPFLQYPRCGWPASKYAANMTDQRGGQPRSDNNGGGSDRRLTEDADRHEVV